MARSRLSRRFEQQTKKSLILSILGIIIFIFVIFKFGIPFLVNFSFFLSKSKYQATSLPNKATFIPAPILNPMPEATNSAEVIISGLASPNESISLYINDVLVAKNKTDKKGYFSFNESLSQEENIIKAKSMINGKESEFSQPLIVTFKKSNPSLTLESPQENQEFSKDQNTVEVRGKTDSDVRVTVNGFWAVVDGGNNFSYNLPLQNGENKINIVAQDNAGNKTEKQIKVNYSP